ncbi:metal-sensing transcriptional repressor [Listeria sp. PSOL-1]|uniref:metal-sensing transcriptional repressor n=1 Tax=Listeria sp. PSOL-1 TaxID=1844999 RepID=UPI0013D0DC4C
MAKIEGHVRSIKTMLQDERDLADIMIQIGAVKKALEGTQKVIFEEQITSSTSAKINKVDLKKQIDSFLR